VAVAAGVIGDDGVRALLTTLDMTAERRRAAALDGRHHLQLVEADVARIGSTPRLSVAAEDIRDLQRWTQHCRGRLGRRLIGAGRLAILGRGFLLWLFALLARLRQQIERTRDFRDHSGSDAGIARRRLQLVVSQQRLNDSDVGAALKQMGREAVAQRMQGHALPDPGGFCRLVE